MRKQHPIHTNYEVTDDGQVWSNLSSRYLYTYTRKNGYVAVRLTKGVPTQFVHRLVLETFVGPCPKGCVCCHANGVRDDNRLENLRWDTVSENLKDEYRHGRIQHHLCGGEKHPGAKLTDQQCRQLIYAYKTGLFTSRELATLHGLEKTTILNLSNKKIRTYLWKGQ